MIDGNQLREEFGRYLAEHKATRWGMDAALMHVCKIAYDVGKADGPGEHLNGAAETLDKLLSERMKRSVKVEQVLQDVADGKRPVLTPDECRMLSLALGTPDEAQTDAQRAMLAAGDHMKEAERLSRVLEDIAQTALRGVENEQIRGHLMDAAALLAHIQRGAVPKGVGAFRHKKSGELRYVLIGGQHDEDEWDDVLIVPMAAAPAPDQFRDAAKMMAEPAGDRIAAAIHYPECWDTAAYPTAESALAEVFAHYRCTEHDAPAEVPMPKPVAYGFGNTAITGHTNRLMMVRIDIPGGDQYAGAFWLPLVLADEAHTYGAACRAAGEAAGYARGLRDAVRDAAPLVQNGEVLVTVTGLTGSGKSAIAGEIEIMCRALGLEVEWGEGAAEKHLTHADWANALEMYRPRVRIVEANIPRTDATLRGEVKP